MDAWEKHQTPKTKHQRSSSEKAPKEGFDSPQLGKHPGVTFGKSIGAGCIEYLMQFDGMAGAVSLVWGVL
jgi:hypothetical protein